MKKHLVTYGDSNYARQREVFKASALASGFFDKVHLFTDLDIDTVFYKKVYAPIKSYRGGGFWIWKPYFIKKVLDSIDDGDVLIYSDAGCVINVHGKKRFDEYIDMLHASETGTIDFKLGWREYQYTKREAFEHFNSPDEIINSHQLHATVIILMKCPHALKLVNEWYNTAVNHAVLFTDEKELPQHPKFIDHRHDQSIFSIIRKTYGANIVSDDTDYYDFKTGEKFPFWAMRMKDKDCL